MAISANLKSVAAASILLIPAQAFAGDVEYGISGSAQGLYGYSDVAERYEKEDDNNDWKGKAEVNLFLEKEFDEDTKLGLYLDVMKGFNKGQKDYNNGDWGKELYTTADTAYGRLMLGETYNVGYQFYQGLNNLGDIDASSFISNPNWDRGRHKASYKTLNTAALNTDGVAPKATYITPEIYSTYAGVTYVPNIYNRRGLVDVHAPYDDEDGYVLALLNQQSFGSIDVSSSLAYAEYGGDDKEYSASISVYRAGWTLAGGFRKTYIDGNKHNIAADLSDNYREGKAYDLGIGYEIGPYEVALTYYNAKADNTDNEDKLFVLSNKYQYNKYLDFYLAAAHVEYQGEDKTVDNNSKGYTFITGVGFKW